MSLTPAQQLSGVTPRAIVLGLLGTAILGVATPYFDLVVQGTWIACCHLPIGVFVLFLLLLGANAPLRRLGLSRAELLTVYALMLVASGIPSFGLTEYLFPTLAGAYYFATPENAWVDRHFAYLPQWLVPYDLQAARFNDGVIGSGGGSAVYSFLPHWLQPGGRTVVVDFYEGLKLGQPVPWGAWVVPLAAWTAAALVLFGALLCLTVLLRRRWIEHERLVFPLVQMPLEMLPEENRAAAAFFGNRLMWLGCALPVLIHSLNGLHFYFPAVPAIPLSQGLNQYFHGRVWSQMGIFNVILHFSVVGFSYLISTELSFSLWFFFLFFILESAVFTFLGVELHRLPGYPTPPHGALQMIGAFVTIAGYMAYSGRQHFAELLGRARLGTPRQTREVARRPWESSSEPDRRGPRAGRAQESPPTAGTGDGQLSRSLGDDRDEPLPLRVAVWGGLALLALFVLWMYAAGVPLGLGAIVIVLFLMFAVVLTRLVSEGGLLFVQAFRPTDVIIACAGTSVLGARSQVILAFVQKALMFDLRTFPMPSMMDAWKLSASGGLSNRRLLPWLGAAILVSIVSSYVAIMLMTYRLGGVRFMSWFMLNSPQQTLSYVSAYLNNPYPTSLANWVLMLTGSGVTVALSVMRGLYAWWPFHPLGYAMGPSWPMIQLWFSFLIGWVLKSLVLRYGGFRRFRDAKPFFLGLVVGEFGIAGVWLLIDMLTGKSGHRFFLS